MPPPSYDEPKEWRGRTYTGMKVGRKHAWEYEGKWTERKIGPDLWDVAFDATKSRKGRAPAGSGAPVGTEYHWFFAPTSQVARKLDANTYQTRLEGLKWKVGFRPATSETWDYEWGKTGETARQRMIRILEQTLADLKAEERAGAAPIQAPALAGERPKPPPRKRAKASGSKTKAKKKPTKKTASPPPAARNAKDERAEA